MLKHFFLHSLILSLSISCLGQGASGIVISETNDIDQAITNLLGDGVKVSNVKLDCGTSNNKQWAEFEDQFGILGMDKGIILSTGLASNVKGPNDKSNIGGSFNRSSLDPDLNKLVNELAGAHAAYDACIVEFDIIVATNELKFNYLWGSEEHPEFVDSDYHDVFGLFLSGPGISGIENIARVPGSNDIVSVGTINENQNTMFHVENGTGDTPFKDYFHQYDGITTVLQARKEVIPCETYHLKIAVADVNDSDVDSGIFIEQGSFESNIVPKVTFNYDTHKYEQMIEGCNGTYVVLERQDYDTVIIDQEVVIEFEVSGTAEEGIDFKEIPRSITIPAGVDTGFVYLEPLEDDLVEGLETVILTVKNKCLDFPDIAEIEIPLIDSILFDMADISFCIGDTGLLAEDVIEEDVIDWKGHSAIICDTCLPTPVYTRQSDTISFEYHETSSGCRSSNVVVVNIENPLASFDFEWKEYYTTLDVFFTNTSVGADHYVWGFGDGNSSTTSSPEHTYSFDNNFELKKYIVQLVASTMPSGCTDTTVAEITIGQPLFIPNIITPNMDQKNEDFEIQGIVPGIWDFEVYNRWGDSVYSVDGYENDWNGHGLSDGTYYFELSNPVGDRKFNGWVQLTR